MCISTTVIAAPIGASGALGSVLCLTVLNILVARRLLQPGRAVAAERSGPAVEPAAATR